MKIEKIEFKIIKNSAKKNCVQTILKTENGTFKASPAYGTSAGKFEVKSFGSKGIKKCIKNFPKIINQDFKNLKELDHYLKSFDKQPYQKIGGNLILGLEIAFLKSQAKEEKKELFQKTKLTQKIPKQLGKIIGGGSHSKIKGPVFQEFLISNQTKNDIGTNLEIHKELSKNFKNGIDMEGGFQTKMLEEDILIMLKNFLDDNYPKTRIGLDIAANEFYKNGKYYYKNKKLTPEKHLDYVSQLIKDFKIFYVEDPFIETDFENFSKLIKKHKKTLICGDDLTVTNIERLKKAILKKSINASIVKPNQIGSLYDTINYVKELKKNKMTSIVSHRSGETKDDFLADLAIGSDYFKIGIVGKERTIKTKRLQKINNFLS